ncbi:hypothetical protein FBZ93_103273 [Bradyrhizobium macuxiense]|uniref:Uncharacterized protein n=1 Tax=Bradyrhizobium macuxiense TaxID=1755647 RepID=A0A560MCD1_9BRAD|nr:hypothetical protein [Bradyrhizobium macuxiense]TWC05260.1 hypothetical protein FBZ93_103273 [Bradyrhizobium macuxiense]
MKTTYLLAALLLAPSLTTLVLMPQAVGHVRTDKSSHLARAGAQPSIGSRWQESGIVGRQIAAPPWSAACTNDLGSQRCDEPMWVYGSPDYVEQFRSAF